MANNKYHTVNMTNCDYLDPQIQLGVALANADLREFRIALDMGAEPTVMDNKHTSVFERALTTYGCAEFVEECLRRGCNPNYINQHLNKAAINFAADSRDPQILNVLLKRKEVLVDRKYSQLTPLNSLAKNLTSENVSDVRDCIKILLDYGASPNLADQRNMTPLHYVLKNRKIDENSKTELIQLFLTRADIDIDTHREGEVRNIIRQEYPDFNLSPAPTSRRDVNCEHLLAYLQNGEQEKFIEQFRIYKHEAKANLKNTQAEYTPLLIESIKRGLHDALKEIIQSGVNINAVHNNNSPMEVAVIWGNWHALQLMLDHEDVKLRKQEHLLVTAVTKLDETPLNSFCDYNKCFYTLLDSDLIDINETDNSGSTPLHYAVKYRNRKAQLELLKRGAYIGMNSVFNDIPIDGMHPDLLEDHFNKCITTNGLKPGEGNFEIIMNYMNFVPQQLSVNVHKGGQNNLHAEMTPIAFIADSKEHRHLLQHPLITSFLFLKWHRLSIIFYINFLLYTLFTISIFTHTVLKFRDSEHEAITTLFGIFSWIGITYLIVREIIQFVISPATYFRSPINYIEIALIVLSIMTSTEPNYDRETQRIVAVFTMMLVALELCLLVGSLPVLSISTHMLMLRAVSKSFLKSFALYSIFVITFTFSFYILFGKEGPDGNTPKTDENGEFNKFTNPVAALIKTIVMLTGEFDAGDIDFYSIYSYLVFLMFVFLMSIVIFNLLNGLAVSDTQAIKAQAELNGSICRTNLLKRYEDVFTNRSGRISFIFAHEPFRSICKRLINLYPSYISKLQIAIQPNNGNKVMIPALNSYEMKEISRGNGVRNSKNTFLPLYNDNEGYQKKMLDPPVNFLPCCCSCILGKCSEMDSRTVKMAMTIIEQRYALQQNENHIHSIERRLHNIEEKLEKMCEMLTHLN